MQTTQLFRHLLGLTSPWSVQRVTVAPKEKQIDVWPAHRWPFPFPCPECGVKLPVYDLALVRCLNHL